MSKKQEPASIFKNCNTFEKFIKTLDKNGQLGQSVIKYREDFPEIMDVAVHDSDFFLTKTEINSGVKQEEKVNLKKAINSTLDGYLYPKGGDNKKTANRGFFINLLRFLFWITVGIFLMLPTILAYPFTKKVDAREIGKHVKELKTNQNGKLRLNKVSFLPVFINKDIEEKGKNTNIFPAINIDDFVNLPNYKKNTIYFVQCALHAMCGYVDENGNKWIIDNGGIVGSPTDWNKDALEKAGVRYTKTKNPEGQSIWCGPRMVGHMKDLIAISEGREKDILSPELLNEKELVQSLKNANNPIDFNAEQEKIKKFSKIHLIDTWCDEEKDSDFLKLSVEEKIEKLDNAIKEIKNDAEFLEFIKNKNDNTAQVETLDAEMIGLVVDIKDRCEAKKFWISVFEKATSGEMITYEQEKARQKSFQKPNHTLDDVKNEVIKN